MTFVLCIILAFVIFFWIKEHLAHVKLKVECGCIQAKLQEAYQKVEEKNNIEKHMKETFQALSYDMLEKNHQTFLGLAKETFAKSEQQNLQYLEKKEASIAQLLNPVKETLSKLEVGIQTVEKERKSEQTGLKEQMQAMIEAEKALKEETACLVKALRSPTTGGKWGELQLRRVIELAGMIEHCDFEEQVSIASAEGGGMRPDVIVHLPDDKKVVVDAKTPFTSYFEAMQTTCEKEKKSHLLTHARLMRAHVQTLGKKEYWKGFSHSPEFVVLFLPSDAFLSAALQHDPSLLEFGVDRGVLLATPMTLIGLLRSIAYGWKQEGLSQHVKEISALGQELYRRISTLREHWSNTGKHLSKAVDAYNLACGSLERRVLSTARKFEQYRLGEGLEALEGVEKIAKQL